MKFLIFVLAVCLAAASFGYLHLAFAETSAASNRTSASAVSTGISLAQNSNIISFSHRQPPAPVGVSRGPMDSLKAYQRLVQKLERTYHTSFPNADE